MRGSDGLNSYGLVPTVKGTRNHPIATTKDRTSSSNFVGLKPLRSHDTSIEDLVRVKERDDDEVEIMIDVDIENVHDIEINDLSFR